MSMPPKISRRRSGWRLFLMTAWGRAYPRVIGQQRDRSWVFFDVFLALMGVAAYVFVYRAIGAPKEYVGFVIVGGAMIAFWTNVLWGMSSQLYWEKETGNLALYIIAPGPLMAMLLGMALGGLVSTTIRATVIIVLGSLLFGVNFTVGSLPLLVLVFFVAMTALYGLGMLTSSLFLLLSREAWHIANLAQEPIYLLSGFYFPIKSFPFWIAAAGSLIPLTLGLDAMRQLAFATGPSLGFVSVTLELAVLVILAFAFLIGSRYLLAYMERLAIREGRITESRA